MLDRQASPADGTGLTERCCTLAKKVTQDAYDAFLGSVLDKFSPEDRALIESKLRDESVIEAASPFLMTRSDYSKSKDELDAREAQLATKQTEWTAWFEDASRQAAVLAESERENKQKIAEYEKLYGPLSADEKRTAMTLDPKQLEDELIKKLDSKMSQHDMAAFKVLDMLSDLKQDHRETFKEKLNTDELVEFATKNNLPLPVAYEKWVEPRMKERQEAAVEDRIKKATDDAVAAALSKHRLPTAPANTGANIFSAPETSGPITNEFERQSKFADNFLSNINKTR